MMSRAALAISFLAILAAVGGLLLIGTKLTEMSRRIAALEQRPAPPPPAPPPEIRGPQTPEEPSPEDLMRQRIRQMADKESEDHLDILSQTLALPSELDAEVREAFTEEFAYYADGVVRALERLERGGAGAEENWLASPEFRRGLEEKISVTDERVRELLTVLKNSAFEKWRRDLRRERYELD